MKNILFVLLMVVVLSACNGGKSKSESNNKPETDTVVKSKEVSLDELTVEVLTILKNKEYKKLADYIHPELGLRFTPYAFIVVEEDVCLKPAEFLSEIEKQNVLNWGAYDGTGDPIKLSINEYFTEFVYTADFLNAEKKSLNEFLRTVTFPPLFWDKRTVSKLGFSERVRNACNSSNCPKIHKAGAGPAVLQGRPASLRNKEHFF
jgi:hypothetical protein